MKAKLAILCALLLGVCVGASRAGDAATPPPAGGADQRASVEGCLGEWLFDGVWRVRATDVSGDGSVVTLEVRNGTRQTLATPDTGFAKINGQGIDLAFSDGIVQNLDTSTTAFREELSYKKLPPGAGATTKLHFAPPAGNAKPVKLLIAVDPQFNSAIHYSVKDPSFRINLNCTK